MGTVVKFFLLTFAIIVLLPPAKSYAAINHSIGITARSASSDKVRIMWRIIPDAVSYEIVILNSPSFDPKKIIYTEREILLNGCEVALVALKSNKLEETYWSVRGLDIAGNPIGDFSLPISLTEAQINPSSPVIVSDYSKMDLMPAYPVYSWIPVIHAAGYEVEAWREPDSKIPERLKVRHFYTYENVLYDGAPFIEPGKYWWRVRALDGNGRKYSEWSEPDKFYVEANAKIAALGDSITHGGGAINTPPSCSLYSWETYAGVPIKNLGMSGDTTSAMLERFERDVLPFSPKILIVMGGVNDFRTGIPANISIINLKKIAEKCRTNGITPVFVTATPIRPQRMKEVRWDYSPRWKNEQRVLNAWIISQPLAVDVNNALTDSSGELRAELTSDGLHPDSRAKRMIGEAIGRFLREKAPSMIQN